jgi:flagellar basal body-associated protein FliL
VLYVVLLVIFLIQFLVALGGLMFVIFLVRPEIPFAGDG